MELLDKAKILLDRLEAIRSLSEIKIDAIKDKLDAIENVELPQLDDEFDEWRAQLYEQGEPNEEDEKNINQIDSIIMEVYDSINAIHEQFGLDEAYYNEDNDISSDPFTSGEDDDENSKDQDQFVIVLREVSKSALKTIGIDYDDPVFVDIMSTILTEIYAGQKDDYIVGRVLTLLVTSGLAMPTDHIRDICKKTREKCSQQLFVLNIAFHNLLEFNCSAEEALSQLAFLL